MRVNSPTKVANLNSDKLDGKDSTEIGVNGWERVTTYGEFNSTSPKVWQTSCPSGKVVVGTGFDINGGKTGFSPDALTNVVIDEVFPLTDAVLVTAYEEEATTADWQVGATAICATAP